MSVQDLNHSFQILSCPLCILINQGQQDSIRILNQYYLSARKLCYLQQRNCLYNLLSNSKRIIFEINLYNIHKKQKNIFTIIIFILLNLSQIRFGSKIFLNSLIQTVGFSFIYLLSIYFIKAAIRNDYNTNSSSNILNLKNYDKLTIRDALWLIQIQNKVKYDAIAIKSKVAPGTVKNRFKFIFSVLEVGDKQGFINEYSTFAICYGEYSSEQISSMTFTDDDFIE